ncbi:MAG TPA: GNAT family N-acetyltransferase [Solirubrobacterales bacterium]|nr:GNAT family N-acetyltransferase [Solirubrobacterales bacterium]
MSGATTQSPAGRPGTVGWEVRPAREDDAPVVAAAVAALVVELGGSPPPRAAIESEARAHIADPSLGIVLVATETLDPGSSSQKSSDSGGNCERTGGGEPVGVLTASWARAIQVAGRLLTIEVLWTRREWRDRGVGAALVEALAAAAAAEGAGRVEVGLPRESFAALRATERFYLANGFERLGPRMRRAVP